MFDWALNKHLHGSSPPNFRGDLIISDQNNWGGALKKKLNLGRGPKILGWGAMNIFGKRGHNPLFLDQSPLF